MTLTEKLNLLNLSAEEATKAKEKFLISLSLVSEDEINALINFLNTQGVKITKARELKVLCNPLEDITKKFDILSEVNETNLYKSDPILLNKNVIDIYRRIKYCIQNNIAYKKADGSYENFLLCEKDWKLKTVDNNLDNDGFKAIEDNMVVVEPIVNEVPVLNDVSDLVFTEQEEETKEPEMKTTNFADLRKDLEEQLKGLEALKDDIGFSEIEPETYGMGRVA